MNRFIFFAALFVSASFSLAEECSAGCERCVASESSWSSDAECQKCAEGSTDWPCGQGQCVCRDNAIQCDAAVSGDGVTDNSACRASCEALEAGAISKEDFSKKCKLEGYTINKAATNITLEGDCFQQWIHGYSDEGLEGKLDGPAEIGTLIRNVDSVSQCQELCQDETSCVSFSWRAQPQGDAKLFHSCLLKTQEMVNQAASISLTGLESSWTDIPSTDERYVYCNMGLGFRCNGHGYECHDCNQDMKCIFKSELHISGPKFCGAPLDTCGHVIPSQAPGLDTTEEPYLVSEMPIRPSPSITIAPITTTTTTAPPSAPITIAPAPTTTTTTFRPSAPITIAPTTVSPVTTTTTVSSTTTSTTSAFASSTEEATTEDVTRELAEDVETEIPCETTTTPAPCETTTTTAKPCHLRCRCKEGTHCGCCQRQRVEVNVVVN